MEIKNPILKIVEAQKKGEKKGIYSICSSNQYVIEACLRNAAQDTGYILIESTSNQVNQFGGYTGMNASQFVEYVNNIANSIHFPQERILFGGDHLGPNAWTADSAKDAMQKSAELLHSSVKAGYSKIHLDASMKCSDDDPKQPLAVEVSAQRAAEMCQAAEAAYDENNPASWKPCYIIGTEVPIPGGTHAGEEYLTVTTPEDAENTIEITKDAFYQLGLQEAWERVVALVVQPGVEFGDTTIHHYDRKNASELSKFIEPNQNLIFEAHSTDYQTPQALREMVEDHFAILKVGPALTFAFREAVFALELIEKEWLPGKVNGLSNLSAVLETAMLENPKNWQKHYAGDEFALKFARKYSFSDRSRYYWPVQSVDEALRILYDNLDRQEIPLTLLSQYLPNQYHKVVKGELKINARELVYDYINQVVSDYTYACGQ